MLKRLFLTLLVALIPTQGWSQATVLQGGAWSTGTAPMYSGSGGSQPIVQNSGSAGSGTGLKELNITARGTGTAPYNGQGSGPDGTVGCFYDGPVTGPNHYLCLNAQAGGGGLISYGAQNGASTQQLNFKVNGTTFQFPFSSGFVVGPGTSVVGHLATWANTTGTLLADGGGVPVTGAGGTNGQIQYNNSGAFGGFTMAGDCTLSQPTITCTKVNGQTVALGGTLTTAAAFTQAGAFATTLTSVGSTNVTLPQSGTLATLAGSEALTNKSINGMTITPSTGTFTLTNGKTLTVSNTVTLAGTDGSTLNYGSGGTLGTAAFTASSAYIPAGSQMTVSLGSDTSLSNTSNYFDGPSVAQGSTGVWFASGTVTIRDSGSGPATFYCKLWDGTTVISSAASDNPASSNLPTTIALSGYLATPAANIRISCRDITATTGLILFNYTGNSRDSTLTAFRVQ